MGGNCNFQLRKTITRACNTKKRRLIQTYVIFDSFYLINVENEHMQINIMATYLYFQSMIGKDESQQDKCGQRYKGFHRQRLEA